MRRSDADFALDFEEIYVIDSKERSITRAKVIVSFIALYHAICCLRISLSCILLSNHQHEENGMLLFWQVTVPGGKNRDRRKDLLTIRDNGTSFKIINEVLELIYIEPI
jgi:hypothetical protein